jgi:hypothetical protein
VKDLGCRRRRRWSCYISEAFLRFYAMIGSSPARTVLHSHHEEEERRRPSSPLAANPHSCSTDMEHGRLVSDHKPKHSDLTIVFSNRNRVYQPNQMVTGFVVVTVKDGTFFFILCVHSYIHGFLETWIN